MFMRETYAPTYSGPFMATGETLSRAKSTAGSNRNFVGNVRAYKPQNAGVRAGSRGAEYRGGMIADSQAAQAGNHNAAAINRAMDDAQSRFAFQSNMAEEAEGLRRLLLDTDQTDRTAENALRRDTSFRDLSSRARQANYRIGQDSRDISWLGWLGGIIS